MSFARLRGRRLFSQGLALARRQGLRGGRLFARRLLSQFLELGSSFGAFLLDPDSSFLFGFFYSLESFLGCLFRGP